MNSLTDYELFRIRELFDETAGIYFLGFTNKTLDNFFKEYGVEIHGQRYQKYGESKAKKLRAFLELENNQLVGSVLSRLLDHYIVYCEKEGTNINRELLGMAQNIANNIIDQPTSRNMHVEDVFPDHELRNPNIERLPIDPRVVTIVKERLKEAKIAMDNGAYLSVILLCGSILEAALLGAAQQDPSNFNKAKAAPKTKNGTTKQFPRWSLAQLIDVACEIGLLGPDVKKFSHGLRDFRNYIHPYQQMSSGFRPNKYTAKLCIQALTTAMAELTDYR